jgi:hypothetical protein
MKLAIRGYHGKSLIFEDRVDVEGRDEVLPYFAEKHAKLLSGAPHMIEIEFLDEPDPLQRFFRFGTDPSGMVIPIEVKL